MAGIQPMFDDIPETLFARSFAQDLTNKMHHIEEMYKTCLTFDDSDAIRQKVVAFFDYVKQSRTSRDAFHRRGRWIYNYATVVSNQVALYLSEKIIHDQTDIGNTLRQDLNDRLVEVMDLVYRYRITNEMSETYGYLIDEVLSEIVAFMCQDNKPYPRSYYIVAINYANLVIERLRCMDINVGIATNDPRKSLTVAGQEDVIHRDLLELRRRLYSRTRSRT